METSVRRLDRRVQRTRQLLQQAFGDVVREKGFVATSVQDIAERANVNRGTFYLHFTDKYMLVDVFVRENFQNLLAHSLTSESRWDRQSLSRLIGVILESFVGKYKHQRRLPKIIVPLVEHAIREELTGYLLCLLQQSEYSGQVPMETVARFVSWGIFGIAIEWSQEESLITLEQMTDDILLIILEGVMQLAPDVLPE